MKTKEEIDELYHKYWDEFSSKYDDNLHYYSFVEGYIKCQEDMADYIFEVAKEFHRLGKYSGTISDTHFTDIYKETINSLNKQD